MHPVLFSLGPIIVYSFSLFLVLGLFLGAFVVWKFGRNEFGENKLFDGILICLISGLVIARLSFVFSHFDFFSFDILRWILFVHYPGFSFWAAVVGAFLGLIFFTRDRRFFIRLADLYTLGFSLMLLFGDFGCFLNGCVVGSRASLPWAIVYPGFVGRRHPVPIYALILDFILFVLAFKIFGYFYNKRKEMAEGKFGLTALFYFGVFVLINGALEFYKEKTLYFRNIPILIPGFVVLGLFCLVIFYKKCGRSIKQDAGRIASVLREVVLKLSHGPKMLFGLFGGVKGKAARKAMDISALNNSLTLIKEGKEREKND